ncbi:FtsX-like permease family protein, partial [candidate division KSB1 bacterium]|nr:FtsX-like permease family protein [candidate division KSB1 bacterium]NIR71303.1 FtsX-like permease family protein [candidate division KSB1 bacterium]NIS24531.1 FtsX-like permease family protein [candidate division KSB1 bacterium]NIT71738.1 FtsX-like permease family protein [candidate division KSB1 bacterium]NIU25140.1 FtsX-like permease family protein [candidate division KSB1 bacterium]
MFKNYLKITIRNIIKHRLFSFINLAGLAVGMACCLLIFLYVRGELSYDHFHVNVDRIYALVNDVHFPTGVTKTAYTSAFPGPTMTKAFPEIEAMTRLARARSSFVFIRQGQHFEERNLLFADSTVFTLFSFSFISGKPQTALTTPYSLVLTKSAARKYFGDANPIGEALVENNGQAYTVTGVLADLPTNSHLQFDGLISMATAVMESMFYFQDRLDLRYATYFLLHKGVKETELEAKFPAFVENLMGDFQRDNNFSYAFSLVPLRDLHLHSEHRGLGKHDSRANIIIFSIIALFILAVACINFMNLATARSALRAREVGVRKAIGARRMQVAWQFLAESTLLSLLALGIAVYLVWLFLPVFNSLAGKSLEIRTVINWFHISGMLGIGLLVGVLAGSYPAMVLSGFQPVAVLKGSFFSSTQGVGLRETLVVLQFAIAVILIVGAMVVYGQRRFMQQQELGFHSEKMLVIDFKGDKTVREQIEAIKSEF